MPAADRPGVLCVDARALPLTRNWLDRFDALVYEQEDAAVPSPVEMQVVVFLAAKQSLDPFNDLLTRPDIDWVLTDDRHSPLKDLYRDVVRKDLTVLLSTDPAEGLDLEDDPDARPIEDSCRRTSRRSGSSGSASWGTRRADVGRAGQRPGSGV